MTLLLLLLVLYGGYWLYSRHYLTVELDPRVRSGLTALRLILLALLAWWVFQQPTYRDRIRVEEPARAVILLDDSRSMSMPEDPSNRPVTLEAGGEASGRRWDRVAGFLEESAAGYLEESGFDAETRLLSTWDVASCTAIADVPRVLDRRPESPQTDITGAVRFLGGNSGDRETQILLFSDGRQTAPGEEPGSDPSAFGVAKYWAFGIGPERLPRNAGLARLSGPGRLRTGTRAKLELHGHTALRGEDPLQLRLELRQRRLSAEEWVAGEVVWSSETLFIPQTVNGGERATFSFPIELPVPEQPGGYILGATVTLSGDPIPEDDSTARPLEVVPAQDPVLILTGQPTWESRYLKRALENDPALAVSAGWYHDEVIHWSEERAWAAERRGDSVPTAPPDQTVLWPNLDRWSVIVLHRLPFDELPTHARARLLEVLENGGRLLLIPGSTGQASATIDELGITLHGLNPSAFVPQAGSALASTSRGAALREILGETTPPLSGWVTVGRLPGGARNILTHRETPGGPELPVVFETPLGLGRAVVSLTDSLWRWDLYEGRGARFWRFVLHRILRPEHTVPGELVVEPSAPRVGDRVRLRFDWPSGEAEPAPRSLPLRVETPQGVRPLTLVASLEKSGRLEADLVASVSGTYIARIDSRGAEVRFEAAVPDREGADITQDRATLQRLAERSGGGYASVEGWAELLERIQAEPYRFQVDRQRPWASRWWVIFLIGGLLSLEWWWRQREGLP